MCKRNWRGAAIALVAAALIIPNAMATTLIVRVVKRDPPASDTPLSGVKVNARGVRGTHSGFTAPDGATGFDLPEGVSYSVIADAAGVTSDMANVCMQGTSMTMTLVLRVRHPPSQSPQKSGDVVARVICPGARATSVIINGAHNIIGRGATDAGGNLVIPSIPWGTYTLNVVARGYLQRSVQFSHTPGAPPLGDIELYPSCARGR